MGLREALDGVPDHRKSQGRRHPLGAILSLAVCAMLCGARSLYAIAQWGRDHGAATGQLLGFRPGKTPCVATFHRVFKDLDVDAFETVLGEWLTNNGLELGETLSLDGKTLRGIHGEGVPGGTSGVSLCNPERGGAGPSGIARERPGVGGGQSGAGSGPSGGPGSGGGRPVDATGGMPADCVRWRGLPVAGKGESARFVAGLGGSIFPHWKVKGPMGQRCPGGTGGNGRSAGQR